MWSDHPVRGKGEYVPTCSGWSGSHLWLGRVEALLPMEEKDELGSIQTQGQKDDT